MKYNIGDKVLVKSIEWYNANKGEYGEIEEGGNFYFTSRMSDFCGKTVTIVKIYEDEGYIIQEDDQTFIWSDSMFERLVERNGKIYPYKIGDRVVLKGNNKCATITNLKYNSCGNLSYYIKIDNDTDISIDYPTDLLLPYNNMFDDEDFAFQQAVAKAVDACLWGEADEKIVYKETDPTEKLVDDSVEFGKNVMRKKISEYLLKHLPMTPDDKEAFVEEMNKNIL